MTKVSKLEIVKLVSQQYWSTLLMPRRSHTGSQRILQAPAHLSRGFHPRKFGRLALLVAMPRPTLACALLLLTTSPCCRAPLTFVRTAASAGWNQTLPGTDDPNEDGLSLILHVSHV